jgi:hypothetical protein
MTRAEWLADYGYAIDDVRAALDWAFSADGDPETGAALTIASLPLAFQISLIEEFRGRAEMALEKLAGVRPPNALAELRLLSALASLCLNASVDSEVLDKIFDRIAVLSDLVGFAKCKIEPLVNRAIFRIEQGDHSGAVEIVARLCESARGAKDPLAVLLSNRAAAQVYHFAGEHDLARDLTEKVLDHPARVIPLAYSQAAIDRRISMRIIQARMLWIEGKPDQAVDLMRECTAMARADGPFTLTQALALGACPIAFWTGNSEAARAYVDELLQHARRHTLGRWLRLGECYSEILNRRESGAHSCKTLDTEPASPLQLELLTTIDCGLVTDEIAARAEVGLGGWCNPELLRAAGERHIRDGGMNANARAEALFLAAINGARVQNALGWELRAATSLACLRQRQNRPDAGRAILGETMARFEEGHAAADYQRALAVLQPTTDERAVSI